MDVNQIIEALKDPKKRKNLNLSHPSGNGFQEMSLEEMNFITGGNGTVQPQVTPVLTPFTPYTPAISGGAAVSAVSGLVSYTKDCI
ncbi:type 2 lantibiotic, family protein [Anoxybacillus sp. B7M1]|uniref:mersacidin family lantibiotic n=1 Tax=unclassified Anoxybacillus TaxID=2639704 RepID=UPI0005CD5955|nr:MULTISPECIES: lichenicidin A2 family type 2 lantibiotic [unclassified Anoxybacillus]ANB57096.1 type 2 lantibiotic, family protein [Anoxybacillus sp. B2M1]ANB64997.1 type 2 lantibiotic, family protein [Anoxybacillus sp. B7M1]